MGFDLISRNKNAKNMSIGFMWDIMLKETGMGYLLGYGSGVSPGSYVYNYEQAGRLPSLNDGFIVTSFDAKAMAKIARGYLFVTRFNNQIWDAMTEEERARKSTALANNKLLYTQKKGDLFLKKLEDFAEFAEKSGGFRIY
jgi:hypothetical protein